MSEILGYVFGYGSLANPSDTLVGRDAERYPEPVYCQLTGYERFWDVAAKNSDPAHDNKYHVDVDTGERPDIRVAVLGLRERPGVRCNGRAIPVDEQRLAWFDRREVLYDRIEVPAERVDPSLEHQLWTYRPKKTARETFEAGHEAGDVYLPSPYKDLVDGAFEQLGPEAEADYRASTVAPRCPLRELELVRAPGDLGL